MATAADFRYAHNDICSHNGYDHDNTLTFCASDAVTGDPYLEIQYAGDTFRLTPPPPETTTWTTTSSTPTATWSPATARSCPTTPTMTPSTRSPTPPLTWA